MSDFLSGVKTVEDARRLAFEMLRTGEYDGLRGMPTQPPPHGVGQWRGGSPAGSQGGKRTGPGFAPPSPPPGPPYPLRRPGIFSEKEMHGYMQYVLEPWNTAGNQPAAHNSPPPVRPTQDPVGNAVPMGTTKDHSATDHEPSDLSKRLAALVQEKLVGIRQEHEEKNRIQREQLALRGQLDALRHEGAGRGGAGGGGDGPPAGTWQEVERRAVQVAAPGVTAAGSPSARQQLEAQQDIIRRQTQQIADLQRQLAAALRAQPPPPPPAPAASPRNAPAQGGDLSPGARPWSPGGGGAGLQREVAFLRSELMSTKGRLHALEGHLHAAARPAMPPVPGGRRGSSGGQPLPQHVSPAKSANGKEVWGTALHREASGGSQRRKSEPRAADKAGGTAAKAKKPKQKPAKDADEDGNGVPLPRELADLPQPTPSPSAASLTPPEAKLSGLKTIPSLCQRATTPGRRRRSSSMRTSSARDEDEALFNDVVQFAEGIEASRPTFSRTSSRTSNRSRKGSASDTGRSSDTPARERKSRRPEGATPAKTPPQAGGRAFRSGQVPPAAAGKEGQGSGRVASRPGRSTVGSRLSETGSDHQQTTPTRAARERSGKLALWD